MGHNTSNEKRRHALIRLPLGDLAHWHLMATCPQCRDKRYLPIGALIDRYGPEHTLSDVLTRLRCRFRTCRQAPAALHLFSKLDGDPGPPVVHVVLKGPGAF